MTRLQKWLRYRVEFRLKLDGRIWRVEKREHVLCFNSGWLYQESDWEWVDAMLSIHRYKRRNGLA